jgi:hypothetical protein
MSPAITVAAYVRLGIARWQLVKCDVLNISLVVSASSLNKRVGFVESLPVLAKLRRSPVP